MSRSCKCGSPARVKRNKTGDVLCIPCFVAAFEAEVHNTIVTSGMFKRGERVAIGASGGKDSTALAKVLSVLNQRYDYGLDLVLVSVDEGIAGYRDDSLETVKENEQTYGIPLKIVSYRDLYGWTMDEIVRKIGRKSNCTFCGVFRRQALDRGAALVKADRIVTGHNADDIAETVVMNMMRGDIARLARCTAITTGTEGMLPRSKPFKYTYEKDICLYVEHCNLLYFSTECKYAPDAYRGYARSYIKKIEVIRPSAIVDIIHSGESFRTKQETKLPVQGNCQRCGYVSSKKICQACDLLEGLNKDIPLMGVGKTNKIRRMAREKGVHLEGLEPAPTCGSCGVEAAFCGCREEKRQQRKAAKKARGEERTREKEKTEDDTEKVEEGPNGDCGGGCANSCGDNLQTRFGALSLDF